MEGINRIQAYIIQCYTDASASVNNAGDKVYKAVSDTFISIGNETTNLVNSIDAAVQHKVKATKATILDTAKKTNDWVYENRFTLIFICCSAGTVTFDPSRVITVAVISLVARIKITELFKNLSDEYLKPEKDAYKTTPHFEVVSIYDLSMGGIAAASAFSLATLFSTTYVAALVLPALGGMAIGNSLAKLSMNWTHQDVPANPKSPQMPLARTTFQRAHSAV